MKNQDVYLATCDRVTVEGLQAAKDADFAELPPEELLAVKLAEARARQAEQEMQTK